MERKNTILLTVIAIATLLVAVVGATFAYFTASTQTTNTGASATIQTNKLDGANITFTSQESKYEMLKYPGGLAVYGAKATIAKQVPGDTNDYQATFSLKLEYTNNTKTDMEWELYMVPSEIDSLNTAATTTCKLREERVEETNETRYWYSDNAANTTMEGDKGCSASAIITKITSELKGTKIASGKLKKETTKGEITKGDLDSEEYQAGSTLDDLSDRVINTKNLQSKYYYLIVRYPNDDEAAQTDDAGQSFSVTLTIDGTPASSVYNG